MRQGFSLVELSIVLVILGLLTGGILTGQSLIRAAELRSVTTEFQTYQTAVMTFRDKYFALPGDMANATDFWGAADNSGAGGECSSPGLDTGTGTQTCNGGGDGQVGAGYEKHRFWQHLANAGLIEGSYTGTRDSTIDDITPGLNSPTSRLGANTGYGTQWDTGTDWLYSGGTHVFSFGADRSDYMPTAPALTAEETWNIDAKLDDGMPGRGIIIAPEATNSVSPGCTTTDDPSTAEYALSNTSITCALKWIRPY